MNTGTRLNDALLSGLAGATALTAVHQIARAVTDSAPRMDVVGMRALARGINAAGGEAQRSRGLYGATLAGDLISNTAYYSLATTYTRGAVMGILAGIGALVLPARMGLGDPPHSERLSNKVMTVAWYTLGGLAAACTANWLANRHLHRSPQFMGGW
jgi:hypothetical protein